MKQIRRSNDPQQSPQVNAEDTAPGKRAFSSPLCKAVVALTCALLLAMSVRCGKESVVEPESTDLQAGVEGMEPVQPKLDVSPRNPQKIFVFGSFVSATDHSLLIEIPQPKFSADGVVLQRSEVFPGRGISGRVLTVAIAPETFVQVEGDDLASLEEGTPLMVGGELSGGSLAADFVMDMNAGEAMRAPNDSGEGAISPGAWKMVDRSELSVSPEIIREGLDFMRAQVGAIPSERIASTEDLSPVTVDFTGKFGGPTWGFDSGDLDIILFLIPYVEIERARIVLGLAGATYDWPFEFEVEGTGGVQGSPLMVGKSGNLEIMAVPQSPASGFYSYYWALGFDVYIDIYVWIPIVGGETYYFHVNVFSVVNATSDPAPMPGEQLDIPHVGCPEIDLDTVPFVPIAGIKLCEEQSLDGDYFYSDVDVQNWQYTNYYGTKAFDGTNGNHCPITPLTNPLKMNLDEFLYQPHFYVGLSAYLHLLTINVLETPTLPLADEDFNFIPTDQVSCDWYGSWLGTCGEQPTALTIVVPTVPVMTSLTPSQWLSRYGETITFQALVRGANGPGSSPKQVTFYDGDTMLATVPIDANDIATFQTAGLSPCTHSIRAEYIGYDAHGNGYPTDKSVTVTVTNDAEWTQREGYWQHQCGGQGTIDFTNSELECFLAIVEHMSSVFSEARDISTVESAHDVIFLRQNLGSAVEQLDRELLVGWLNFANGGIDYRELLDSDKDGIGDTLFMDLAQHAETVRLDPSSTAEAIKTQTSILHRAIQMQVPRVP